MKVLICGAFDFVTKPTGGQPVKARTLYYALADRFGKSSVEYIETIGWKKRPARLLLDFIDKAKRSEIIIMLPAQKGIQVFSRLLPFAKKLYGCRVFYDVIGGWLPEIAVQNSTLTKRLKKFDGIWVETSSMKTVLGNVGLSNVAVVPNFKKLSAISESDFLLEAEEPYKLCLFSRVMKEKGIEDAIQAVKIVNQQCKRQAYSLDIYGPIDSEYRNRFEFLKKEFPPYIQYRGVVPPNCSVETLKNYYILLFPTYYEGEGAAGTLVDSLFAGLPVIASDWRYNSEIVADNQTGLIFKTHDINDLCEKLTYALANKSQIVEMKSNCIAKATQYSYEGAIHKIVELLNIRL